MLIPKSVLFVGTGLRAEVRWCDLVSGIEGRVLDSNPLFALQGGGGGRGVYVAAIVWCLKKVAAKLSCLEGVGDALWLQKYDVCGEHVRTCPEPAGEAGVLRGWLQLYIIVPALPMLSFALRGRSCGVAT